MYQPSVIKRLFHKARRLVAEWWLGRFPKVKVIGVTGSYGKTNTVRAVSEVLKQRYEVLSTDIDLDTVYNLPITLLKLRRDHEIVVLEYGIDHIGEMEKHLELVIPDIGVMTGITPVHTDKQHLGSVGNLLEEKAKLIKAIPSNGLVIANGDDEQVKGMLKGVKARVVTYGLSPDVDYQAKVVRVTVKGTEMTVIERKAKSEKRKVLKIGLIGRHFAHTALVAYIIGQEMGITDEQIKNALGMLSPLSGRMSIEPGPRGTLVMNDAKRANPASTEAGLRTLAEVESVGRRIAVLGEMGEINEALRIKEHVRIGELTAKLSKSGKVDYFLGIGPLMKYAVEVALKLGMSKERVVGVANVHEAAEKLRGMIRKGDLIYLKGSLLRHLERVLLILANETVGCKVVGCPFYHQCTECKYLLSGYKGK